MGEISSILERAKAVQQSYAAEQTVLKKQKVSRALSEHEDARNIQITSHEKTEEAEKVMQDLQKLKQEAEERGESVSPSIKNLEEEVETIYKDENERRLIAEGKSAELVKDPDVLAALQESAIKEDDEKKKQEEVNTAHTEALSENKQRNEEAFWEAQKVQRLEREKKQLKN